MANGMCCSYEIHLLLEPMDTRNVHQVDQGESLVMQNHLLKGLLTLDSKKVAVVVTGSCLAVFWAAIGDIPTHGKGPVLGRFNHITCRLPIPQSTCRQACTFCSAGHHCDCNHQLHQQC